MQKCDINLRKSFYESILISGGTSMLPGFPTRLKEDISNRYHDKIKKTSSSVKIRVLDSPSRKYNVFIGASIVAKETEDYNQAWTYKQMYDEKGKERLAQEMSLKLR